MKKIIFVSGIHGVGKTTFSRKFSEILSIPLYSASALIKKQNSSLEFPDKKIKNVETNQDVLIQAIDNFVFENELILDGHFTLQKENTEIVKVPIATFQKINPQLLILLLDDPSNIQQRIYSRNKNNFDLEFLRNMQNEELKYAQKIAETLNITLLCLNGLSEFDSFLEKIRKGDFDYAHSY